MSIRLETIFDNSLLPVDSTYYSKIIALPALLGWWRSGLGVTLASGKVSAWNDALAASPIYSSPAGIRPTYSEGQFGSYPGHVFDGVDDQMSPALNFDHFSAFSWVMIFKAAAPAAQQYMMSTFEALGVGTWIRLNNSGQTVDFSHGNGVTSAPFVANTPTLAIGGYSNYYVSGRVNGYTMSRVASNNAGGSQSITLGSANSANILPAAFSLAEIMIFQRNLMLDGSTIALIEDYASRVYGCQIKQ